MQGIRFGFAAVLFLLALPACARQPQTWYVDYAQGKDGNTGRTPQQAWKHAPGDPAATGTPAGTTLQGGDVVQFRAGVPYRGSVTLRHSGAKDKPITFTGTGWGTGRAIIDGANPVISNVPCPSAESCGGAANWKDLRLVTFDEPEAGWFRLYDRAGPVYSSQYPVPPDLFNNDDRHHYLFIEDANKDEIQAGRLKNAELARLAEKGGPYTKLALWVRGNWISHYRVDSVSGDTIYFNAKGLKLHQYQGARAALVDSPHTLAVPGTLARLSATSAVVWPHPDGGELVVGDGRSGINVSGQSHIVISGLHFVHGTGASGVRQGVAILNTANATSRDILIENNIFGPAAMRSGRGIFTPTRMDGVIFRNNRIDTIEYGSGVRTGAGVSNIQVIGNLVTRFGRTGIYYGGVENGIVRGNIVHDAKSVHGNGMSFYLSNRNILVQGNCVFDATRPITFHGNKKGKRKAVVNNLIFRDNILVSTPDAQAALSSWGNQTDGVTIYNNILLGGKRGIMLQTDDKNVKVVGNLMTQPGYRPLKGPPAGWLVRDNQEAPLSAAGAGKFSASSCTMKGHSGVLTVSLTDN